MSLACGGSVADTRHGVPWQNRSGASAVVKAPWYILLRTDPHARCVSIAERVWLMSRLGQSPFKKQQK
jgi:hypothetical protein